MGIQTYSLIQHISFVSKHWRGTDLRQTDMAIWCPTGLAHILPICLQCFSGIFSVHTCILGFLLFIKFSWFFSVFYLLYIHFFLLFLFVLWCVKSFHPRTPTSLSWPSIPACSAQPRTPSSSSWPFSSAHSSRSFATCWVFPFGSLARFHIPVVDNGSYCCFRSPFANFS